MRKVKHSVRPEALGCGRRLVASMSTSMVHVATAASPSPNGVGGPVYPGQSPALITGRAHSCP